MPEPADYESRTDRELILETLVRTRRLNQGVRILIVMGGLCVLGVAVCAAIALQVLWRVVELTTALGAQ